MNNYFKGLLAVTILIPVLLGVYALVSDCAGGGVSCITVGIFLAISIASALVGLAVISLGLWIARSVQSKAPQIASIIRIVTWFAVAIANALIVFMLALPSFLGRWPY